MSDYIETRKAWIEAIHRSITEKWNPICMGCFPDDYSTSHSCALCQMGADCHICSLGKAGEKCNDKGSLFYDVCEADGCDNCTDFFGECSNLIDCPYSAILYAVEAEAMLEALIQLLPESEHVIYGG